jgi:hypothetical protein
MKTMHCITGLIMAGCMLGAGCATCVTHRIAYPASDDLFITMGDDPGSESVRPYSPKGTMIHVSRESYIPLPLLGLATIGNANPQYVFEEKILPKVRAMGGDALTNARVDHIPPPNVLSRLIGITLMFRQPSTTIVTGQAVKR